ncbi:MBL fold metallo-hydrolase [Anaeromyxobacter oryzae]|uniref:MBL fold hydrolase n=1 Tax=Anaeromyxobacter oryzae TaxID=2918170 RepID=A0ABM7WTD9_9BACT|nr:MBL fold metallo-hydrolase [Anaeromyxobacter oryzae]BDG02759.1 MBL fold hydrolase [Anaeromyxobacter oryzae]
MANTDENVKRGESGRAPRTMDRRGFIRDVTMGGAAVLAAGALGAPGAARACPGDGGAYDQVIPVGAPVAIGELKSLKVTCLSEVGWWSTPQFLADIDAAGGMSTNQWTIPFDPKNSGGYSALIEAQECDGTVHTVLLDTGWNTQYMSWVFRREGVAEKLENGLIDRAILSHEHLDHFWGLPALTALNRKVPFWVPSTLSAEAWNFIDRSKLKGPITQVTPGTVHKHFPGFASAVLDVPIILGVRGEQILYFNVKDKGMVIVTGCGHVGIQNAIAFAQNNIVTSAGRFYGLFGGLHISALETWSPAADQMLDAMQAAQFSVVASNHCTGITAVEKMIERGFPMVTGSANYGSKSSHYIGNGDSIVF